MTGDTVTVARMRPEIVAEFRTPRGGAAPMRIRDETSDWNTLTACMTQDEYGLRDWHGSGWALDIGGHIGGVAIGLALDNPDLRVIAVEPVPDNARLLRENVTRNGVADRVTVLEGPVGNGGPVTVWYGAHGPGADEHHAFIGSNSLAYDHGGESAHDETGYPTSYGIPDLMTQFGIERVALCKIDTEGAEWAFLDTSAVALVDLFVGEWHAVRGHVQSDLLALLAATHDVTFTGSVEGPGGFRAVRR